MKSVRHSRRAFLKSAALAASASALGGPVFARWRWPRQRTASANCARPPLFARTLGTKLRLGGAAGHYVQAVSDHWLETVPSANPAILQMFRDRDRQPLRDLVPWAGEFAGKYLTSAVQMLRVREDAELRAVVGGFVQDLVSCQDTDGYLGPWPRDSRLTGHAPNVGKSGGATWDGWGHYHVMMGLLLWHEDTASERALAAAGRIGDLFCRTFAEKRLVDTGSTEMNLAPIHALCRLHTRTGDARYLAQAQKICDEFAAKDARGKPLAGDYLNAALKGTEFFQMPKPRWESLHPIMGFAELYWITGQEDYRRALEHIWWSIVKLDRHNNGGFSSGEQAQGNPYHPGAIETCCTIAWVALGVEMLRMTGNSVVADELELSTLNSVLGLHSPSGCWATYNTPMDGVRKASAHDIVFQAREGSPELNCCSVNAARGLGMISDWALMTDSDGLILNWYGPSVVESPMMTIQQDTVYPRDGHVRLKVASSTADKFTLKLRIPYWSRQTEVKVNGKPVENVQPGNYLSLSRTWRRGDRIDMGFDFSPHFWDGERECEGKVSMYRGPILLTYDRQLNDMDPAEVPAFDAKTQIAIREQQTATRPMVEADVRVGNRVLRLCDFASAGDGGSPYRSWLPITGVGKTEFSRENPLRSSRAT